MQLRCLRPVGNQSTPFRDSLRLFDRKQRWLGRKQRGVFRIEDAGHRSRREEGRIGQCTDRSCEIGLLSERQSQAPRAGFASISITTSTTGAERPMVCWARPATETIFVRHPTFPSNPRSSFSSHIRCV